MRQRDVYLAEFVEVLLRFQSFGGLTSEGFQFFLVHSAYPYPLLGLIIGGLHRFAYNPREAGPLQLDICCVLGQFSVVFEPEFLKQAGAIRANCLRINI